MDRKPFFSVITCTYNSFEFIGQNIESVKKQTFKNYEHIFIDGFSQDSTLKTLEDYRKTNFSRVRIYQYKPKGVANAFNRGIKQSKGQYLIHLNSDDCFADECVLEDVHSYLADHSEIDWIYGMVNIVNERTKKTSLMPKFGIFKYSSALLLKFIDYIPHQSVFIKKNVFKKFGLFDEDVRYLTDYEYWLRVVNKTKWTFFNRVISNYMARVDSVSLNRKNITALQIDTNNFHKKYTNFIENQIFMLMNYSVFSYVYRWFKYYK